MLNRYLRPFVQSPGGVLEMPPALDTITSTGTQIGSSLAALTVVSGDSFQIKNAALTSNVWMLNFWADVQLAGVVRIRSPKLHDNVDAIRSRTLVNCLDPLLPFGVPQKFWPQDIEIVELQGSTTASQIESVVQMMYYDDLPGASARFITPDQLKARMKNFFGNRIAITLGTTAAYAGSLAINNAVDLLKANTDYAVLGMTTDLRVAGIFLRGPDTSNLRCPVPGGTNTLGALRYGAQWFRQMSTNYGIGLIPVINSANKGATQIDCMADNNGGTANVTIWLAELGS
jgi:hypothetical protein